MIPCTPSSKADAAKAPESHLVIHCMFFVSICLRIFIFVFALRRHFVIFTIVLLFFCKNRKSNWLQKKSSSSVADARRMAAMGTNKCPHRPQSWEGKTPNFGRGVSGGSMKYNYHIQ